MEKYSYVCSHCRKEVFIKLSPDEVRQMRGGRPCDIECSKCHSINRTGIFYSDEEKSAPAEEPVETRGPEVVKEEENPDDIPVKWVCKACGAYNDAKFSSAEIDDIKKGGIYEVECAHCKHAGEFGMEQLEDESDEEAGEIKSWTCSECKSENSTHFTPEELKDLDEGEVFELSCSECGIKNDVNKDKLSTEEVEEENQEL